MEQVITVQQAQADIWAIIEQVRNLGSAFILTDKDKPAVKIILAESNEKSLSKNKRNAGFLKNKVGNTSAPSDFDRMNEDEIFKMFAGETIEPIQ